MEFSVSKTDLVRELNLSHGVVEKKTTIPILSNVLLEAYGDRLQLTATDLELSIRCSCPARVQREGSGTVPIKKLLDYVRLLPDAEVNVKLQENHWVSLTCGRSRTRIAGMSRESYPELPEAPEVMARILAPTLSSMISKTIFAISNEESRFALNGALLELRPESLIMVSTDGHRLALVEAPEELSELAQNYRVLIPRKAMTEISRLSADSGSEGRIDFAADENHLFFRFGDRQLISRKLTGTFPDYERVLPKDATHSVNVPREELRGAIERVSQFADDRTRAIRLQVEPGEMKIFSSISETGESEESLPIDYDDESVMVAFNAQYMLDFLRATPEEEVGLLFRDANAAGELRPVNGAPGHRYRYVVMPMRV